MKGFIIAILTLVTLSSVAQEYAHKFGVGTWREHLPYTNVISVAHVGTRMYAATPSAMYYREDEDGSLERVTKVNMLSDFAIADMKVNEHQEVIVVGYVSGNIDLIVGDEVVNISAIVSSNVVGDKGIYKIHCEDELAYLACGFGIVVLDVKRQEVKDTYVIGPGGSQIKVNDITIDDTYIYAATEYGIYKADKNAPFLSDYNEWSRDETIPRFDTAFSIISKIHNDIVTVRPGPSFSDDSLYYYDGASWTFFGFGGNDYYAVEVKDDDEFMILHNTGWADVDTTWSITKNFFTFSDIQDINPNFCWYDGTAYWVGDRKYGMAKVINNWNHEQYLLSGPLTNEVFHMDSKKDRLYVAAGRINEGAQLNNTYNSGGVYNYDQYNWSRNNYLSDEVYMAADSAVYDICHVSVDPQDENHVFASSFRGGLVELQDQVAVGLYNQNNSTLEESSFQGAGAIQVYGTDFDNYGNLWVGNAYAENPLSVRMSDGTWKSFSCGSEAKYQPIKDVMVDNVYGYIWMAVKGKGILVYDNNQTPLDNSDDQYEMLTIVDGDGALPSDEVNKIVVDRDGEVWIGTDHGPAVIYNIQGIFDGNGSFDAQQILIDQDGVIQLLLENENIVDIVVDGGDRKWFGTSSGGLFLMSEDGTQMIHSFTEDNSPLFSNQIISLAMNEETGELYIGTQRGIMGYKGEATEPESTFDQLIASPNPVRPDYDGYIAVNGLKEDSDVTITDAGGNVVYRTTSKGGQFIWTGNTLAGERVKSGVYYIFAADKEGRSKASTKNLVH